MPNRQTLERLNHFFLLASHDDEHIIEAGVADLAHGSPYERLVAEHQYKFWLPHSR